MALKKRSGISGLKGVRVERCIHQGRKCRNCVGDPATRPTGFTSSEPCYGSWPEGSRFQLRQTREAYETAQKIEDVNERRRQSAAPLRDMRYFAARVRTAQVITDPTSTDTVAFGSTVTFRRDDGRVQKYRIVGEDEADPKSGSISFVSPVARLLMGKAVGDVVGTSGQELEIIAIS
jgi:transcription elongation GreA/GreB family factor